jgi:hypothetical protein
MALDWRGGLSSGARVSGHQRIDRAYRCRIAVDGRSVYYRRGGDVIVTGEPVARFVSERLGFGLCPPYSAMGLERGGAIIGGALFNGFEGADVHVTVAGTGWTREFLRAAGTYIYDQLGCARATITTGHRDVMELALRLGGKREGVLRDHFGPGSDAVIVGILRHEYRYLERTPVFG